MLWNTWTQNSTVAMSEDEKYAYSAFAPIMEFTAGGGSESPQASAEWWIEDEGQWLKPQGGRLKEGTLSFQTRHSGCISLKLKLQMNIWTASEARDKTAVLNKKEKYCRFLPWAHRLLLLLLENAAFTAKETKDGVIIWLCMPLVVASVILQSVLSVDGQTGHQKPDADDGSKPLERQRFSRVGRGLEDASRPYLGHLSSRSQRVANKLLLRICKAVSSSHCMKDSFINTFFSFGSNFWGKCREEEEFKKESLTSSHQWELIYLHCFLKAANVTVLLNQEVFDHSCGINIGAAP